MTSPSFLLYLYKGVVERLIVLHCNEFVRKALGLY